jgi:cobalamin synthase
MLYPDLFAWWIISISWSAVFLTAVSIYLYVKSRKTDRGRTSANPVRLMKDFVFVWVLLGLLSLYIVSISRASSTVFAAGNVVVEVILIVYTVKNRRSQSSLS